MRAPTSLLLSIGGPKEFDNKISETSLKRSSNVRKVNAQRHLYYDLLELWKLKVRA